MNGQELQSPMTPSLETPILFRDAMEEIVFGVDDANDKMRNLRMRLYCLGM
jgi:hypothetical protein